MFANKHLKQLKDVQDRIKSCKSSLAKLKPPQPSSIVFDGNMYHFFDQLSAGIVPDIDFLTKHTYNGKEHEMRECLRELGKYFIHIDTYVQSKRQYDAELKSLQQEEHLLKNKLGIN